MMGPGAMGMPEPKDVARLYCSSGTASCTDLNFAEPCQCPAGCEVYQEYNLTQQKYCERGSADQVG